MRKYAKIGCVVAALSAASFTNAQQAQEQVPAAVLQPAQVAQQAASAPAGPARNEASVPAAPASEQKVVPAAVIQPAQTVREVPLVQVVPARACVPAMKTQAVVPAATLVPASQVLENGVKVTPSADGKSIVVEIPTACVNGAASCPKHPGHAIPAVHVVPAAHGVPAPHAVPATPTIPAASGVHTSATRTFRSGNATVTISCDTTVDQPKEPQGGGASQNVPGVRVEKLENGFKIMMDTSVASRPGMKNF